MKEKPYLVQILQKPLGTEPMPEKLRGLYHREEKLSLTDEESEWINLMLRWVYMGSSEYQFGAIRNGMHNLARSQPTAHQITIQGKHSDLRTGRKGRPKSAIVHIFCNPENLEQVTAWIQELAQDDYGKTIRCKETPRINSGLFDPDSSNVGWLDLENNWLATTSPTLLQTMTALCEPNGQPPRPEGRGLTRLSH